MTRKNEVVKCGGHCYDGCGWQSCYFWDRGSTKDPKCRCLLFGGIDGVKKCMSRSIPQCNKVFGTDCEKVIETYEKKPGVIVSRGEKYHGEWVVMIDFNNTTVIAHDKDREKAVEKAGKVGVPIVGKVGDNKNQGVLLYMPKKMFQSD